MQDMQHIDIHALLAERKQIAAIWGIEDVQEIRCDLDEDQCWDVLKQCEKQHDCNYGITWDLIECVAQYLFGDAPENEDGRAA